MLAPGLSKRTCSLHTHKMREVIRALYIVCLCLGLISCARPDAAQDVKAVRDLSGEVVNLGGDHPTVFIFTAVDCPISNRYAPELNRIMNTYKSSGVKFYLVYPDAEDGAIRNHLKEYSYSCKAVNDSSGVLVHVSGATVTPEAAVFMAEPEPVYLGRIDDRYVDFGKTRVRPTERNLVDALDALKEGKEVSVRRDESNRMLYP